MLTHLERSAETITDPKVRQVYAYWLDARGDRSMPSRADIDPLDLRFCLGWVCLVDVVYDPDPRFRFRLDGSRLTNLTGMDLTGQYVDMLDGPAYRDFILAIYNRVVTTKEPVFIANMAQWSDRGYRVEQVTMPLSNDGVTVHGLMDVTIPTLVPAMSER